MGNRTTHHIPNKDAPWWKLVFAFRGELYKRKIQANTKSEARSLVKYEMNLKRLPVGSEVTRVFAT